MLNAYKSRRRNVGLSDLEAEAKLQCEHRYKQRVTSTIVRAACATHLALDKALALDEARD